VETRILFDLPPILGLLPIFLYMVLGFKGVHPLLATFVSCLLGAVLSLQSPISFAAAIESGATSFLARVGLLVVFGSALAEVLKESGGARLLIVSIMKMFGTSPTKVLIGTMVSIVLLTMGMGSMIAASALVATVAVTIAAAAKVSPAAMGIAFHMGGAAGLFIGPFTAPTVQMLRLGELTYFEYLFSVSGPMALILFVLGIVMACWAQRTYASTVQYPPEEIENVDADKSFTEEEKRSALAFAISITALVSYGIFIRGGMTFAFVIMLIPAIITGLAAGFGPAKVMDTMLAGASRSVWFFLMFVFFDPFIAFVGQTGAFTALLELMSPLIDALGSAGFIIVGTVVGIFGISGAAVAQVVILDEMYRGIFDMFGNIPLALYLTMLFMSAQITSFAYPGADMMCQMGFARSKHIKSMVINGIIVTLAMITYITIRALLTL